MSIISGTTFIGGLLKPPASNVPSACPWYDAEAGAAWKKDVKTMADEVVAIARSSARELAADPAKALEYSRTSRQLRSEVARLKGDWAPGSTQARGIVLGAMQASLLAGALDAIVYHAVKESPAPLEEGPKGNAYSQRMRSAAESGQPSIYVESGRGSKRRSFWLETQKNDVSNWQEASRDGQGMVYRNQMRSDLALSDGQNTIWRALSVGNGIGALIAGGQQPVTMMADLAALTQNTTRKQARAVLGDYGEAIEKLPGVESVKVGWTGYQRTREGYPMKEREAGLVVTARDNKAKRFLENLLSDEIKGTNVLVHLAREPLPPQVFW
ncbi:MAG: hypothetical protein HY319_23190 [Armatimonadetes bacterium]|nr:hypothetical protein [Armatimonadota bacterium]